MNPQLRIFSGDLAIEQSQRSNVLVYIVGWIKWLAQDYFLFFVIKSNRNNWNTGFLCDVIKSGPELLYFFPRPLRSDRKNKMIFLFKNTCDLFDDVAALSTVYGIAAPNPEQPT